MEILPSVLVTIVMLAALVLDYIQKIRLSFRSRLYVWIGLFVGVASLWW